MRCSCPACQPQTQQARWGGAWGTLVSHLPDHTNKASSRHTCWWGGEEGVIVGQGSGLQELNAITRSGFYYKAPPAVVPTLWGKGGQGLCESGVQTQAPQVLLLSSEA